VSLTRQYAIDEKLAYLAIGIGTASVATTNSQSRSCASRTVLNNTPLVCTPTSTSVVMPAPVNSACKFGGGKPAHSGFAHYEIVRLGGRMGDV
jgi:hypothetical protein